MTMQNWFKSRLPGCACETHMPICVVGVLCLFRHAVFAERLAKLIARCVGWWKTGIARGLDFVLLLASTMLVSAHPFPV